MRILKNNLKQCKKERCFKESWIIDENFDGHCCTYMSASLRMCDIGIDYEKKIRRYDLSVPGRFLHDSTVCPAVEIFYCPWCATKLPGSLGQEWEDILAKEYNIVESWEPKQAARIPVEFQTDEWWKKRRL